MFQSGYLTIDRPEGKNYVLKVPNKEVEHAFSVKLARHLTGKGQNEIKNLGGKTREALASFDSKAMAEVVSTIVNWLAYPP
jgi:hypothetical protein